MLDHRIHPFRLRLLGTLAALSLLLLLPTGVLAQAEPPPVLIWPPDGAHFLPGARFDVRVEVHTGTMPDDFNVTIDGEDMSAFFAVEPQDQRWEFGDAANPTDVQSVSWREVAAPAPGAYSVEVTAGGETHTAAWTVVEPQAGEARNVILFIGDAMTVPMITSARVMSRGIEAGQYGGAFVFDDFAEVGLSHTSSLNALITDSSAGGSAPNTGHKAANGAVGAYTDSSPSILDDPRVETFAEIVRRTRGMAVGVVTTADLTDATPSAVYGHASERTDEARSAFAVAPLDGGLLPEVMLGGGARYMLPQVTEGSKRADDRDVLAEYEAAGYSVVRTATELEGVTDSPPEHLLGVFQMSDMNVWLDRNLYTDNLGDYPDQPGLVEMTLAALEVLNQNENGWYLMVEAASIDKQMHYLDEQRTLADLIELERAVGAAVEWTQANAPDTLIVVTADHGQPYDTYGTVNLAEFEVAADDAARLGTIDTQDESGFPTYADADNDFFPDEWDPTVALVSIPAAHPPYTEDFLTSPVPRAPSIKNEAGISLDNPEDDPEGLTLGSTVPLAGYAASVHNLSDVPIFADGPGSEHFGRVMDNTEIFFGMAYAIGLDPSAEGGRVPGRTPVESVAAPAVEEVVLAPTQAAAEEPTAVAEAAPAQGEVEAEQPPTVDLPELGPRTLVTAGVVAAVLLVGIGFVGGLSVRRR